MPIKVTAKHQLTPHYKLSEAQKFESEGQPGISSEGSPSGGVRAECLCM